MGERREIWIDRSAGKPRLKLLIYVPDAPVDQPRSAIYHIHGGGYVLGSALMSDTVNRLRAHDHNAVVASVDYGVSPESAFPEPVEDCYDGLTWLFNNAADLGVDPARIVVIGESAGGGLAAALCLLARDRSEVTPAAQFLIYPMLDYRTGSADDVYRNPTTGNVGWSRRNNQFGWKSLRGSSEIPQERVGHFSPSLVAELVELPPTFIATGALDLFLDECVNYAMRLSHAGVPIELHVYPGAPHGFDGMCPDAEISKSFEHDRDRALNRALRKSEGGRNEMHAD
ncbi:MAG: alpha/beta hydrolase [Alphaproteobacteria bacterium]|nr:alpha/beta hydrolase [Alphaproteobacteria bacterium]